MKGEITIPKFGFVKDMGGRDYYESNLLPDTSDFKWEGLQPLTGCVSHPCACDLYFR